MTIIKVIRIHVVVAVNRIFLYGFLLALLRTHRGVNNVLSWCLALSGLFCRCLCSCRSRTPVNYNLLIPLGKVIRYMAELETGDIDQCGYKENNHENPLQGILYGIQMHSELPPL